MSSIFISYRRADSPDAVARIFAKLVARLRNRDVFYDHTSIELGAEFPEMLRHKVTAAGVVLVVIGPKWVEELQKRRSAPVDFVREEICLALASGADVIPVLVGHAVMPIEADLADFPELLPLLRKNAKPVPPDPQFEVECEKLIAHLERTGPSDIVGSLLAGKYKVQRQIGEGGMGDIYVAEQTNPVKRLVAVKLIKAGMDTKEVLARFDAERQALAVMDHPNVCKVLDAGTAPNGRPFFVMEYVKGVPITKFCDDRKLTPKERLDLFMTVCKGVQHAHQKGIIHRDIKPANVLVETIDGKPVPKVIDFGLAKAMGLKLTDKSFAATEFGKWVGTLEYSSPEQAEGRFDIDTLSDVYSLGVLLYELLAGSPPFSRAELMKASDEEMKRVIKEDLPALPSKRLSSSQNLPAIAANRQLDPNILTKKIQGDLDWIIMKALDKAPERRYATPTALADDVHRHLKEQPITAGKPSTVYQLRKFVRRNRGTVIAAAMVFLSLIAGVIGTGIGFMRTEKARLAEVKQRERTTVALVQSEENRKLAEKRFDEKRGALDEMLRGFSDDRLKLLPGSQQIRQVFFEKGLEQYAQILSERQGDPLIQARLADSYRELGVLRGEVGDPEEALAALQKAVDLRRLTVVAARIDGNATLELGESLFQLGQFHYEQKRIKDAVAPVEESVDLFGQLYKLHPDNARYKFGLGRGLTRLASLKSDDKEQTLKRARILLQEASDELSNDAEVLTELSRTFNNLYAVLPPERKSTTEGLNLLEQAIKYSEEALALNPNQSRAHVIRAAAIQNRVTGLANLGRENDSLQVLIDAVNDSKTFVKKNPAVVRASLSQVELQEELALRYQKTAKLDEAISIVEDRVRVFEGLAQRFPDVESYQVDRMEALFRICDIEMGRSQLTNAARALDRVVIGADETIRIYDRSPRVFGRIIRAYSFRGELEDRQERPKEALRICRDGLRFFARHPQLQGGDSPPSYQAFVCAVRAANYAKKLEDHASLIEVAERGCLIAESFVVADEQRERLDLLRTLAGGYEGEGQTDMSIGAWNQVREESERLVRQKEYDYGARIKLKESLQHLVNLYRRNGDLNAEIQTARELLKVWNYLDGKDYDQAIAESAEATQKNADRLRSLLESPPRIIPITLKYEIHISESLQPFEDQIRWLEEVQKVIYPVETARMLRAYHHKCLDKKISFVDLCTYAFSATMYDDEQKIRVNQLLNEITRLNREFSSEPQPFLRHRLAETHLALAEEYSSSIHSSVASMRSLEDALAYLEITTEGEPRRAEDKSTLARVRAIHGKIEDQMGNSEKAYQDYLDSLRIFPGNILNNEDTDSRRHIVASTCLKLGRRTEAAYWFLVAAELGDPAAVQSLGELYLVEPRIAAVFPQTLADGLGEIRLSSTGPLDNLKTNKQIKEVWKRHRTAELVSNTLMPVTDRVRLLMKIEAFDASEAILNTNLNLMPNDILLQKQLALWCEKVGWELTRNGKHSEAADAYKRCLEAGAVGSSPDLLADYLRALIRAGRADKVKAEALRFADFGLRDREKSKGYQGFKCIICGLRGIAAAVIGESAESDLREAKAAAIGKASEPGYGPYWDWNELKEWSDIAILEPDRRKAVDFLLGELKKLMPAAVDPRKTNLVLEDIIADQYTINLVRGKNSFGDPIYAYVKMTSRDLLRFETAMKRNASFILTEFGIVVAAGRGEPDLEIQREIITAFPASEMNTIQVNPYLSALSRGMKFVSQLRYYEALAELKTACDSPVSVANDFTLLGQCYGRLGRWEEAIAAHTRALELETKAKTGSDAALSLFESYIVAGRTADLEPFITGLLENKWQPREEKSDRLNQANAMLYGFRAIAQLAIGKEATEFETKSKEYSDSTNMHNIAWDWKDIGTWIDSAKLDANCKERIELILSKLKGVNLQDSE